MQDGILTVNIHTEKECEDYSLSHEMPDNGKITLKLKKDCLAGFRIYEWMGDRVIFKKNGEPIEAKKTEEGVIYTEASCGDALTLEFSVETVVKKEFFAGREYTEYWRGGDMIDIEPRGEHIRLYQRDNEKEKYYPTPDDVVFTGTSDRGPTQMSPDK
jgi:hypothetical protein